MRRCINLSHSFSVQIHYYVLIKKSETLQALTFRPPPEWPAQEMWDAATVPGLSTSTGASLTVTAADSFLYRLAGVGDNSRHQRQN